MFSKNFSKIKQPVALLTSKHLKNFENGNTFFCLEIAEINNGVQFWDEKNDSGH